MTTQQFAYPLDTSGVATSNLVQGERHTITPANGLDFLFFVPFSGPYFLDSMLVKHVQSGQTLQMGVDWAPGWKFESATDSPPYLSVYGAIVLLNSNYNGAVLELKYQTLGGQYTLDTTTLTTILANVTIDPRISTWENVTEVPGQFIADPHLHHIQETMGYDDLVQAIIQFKDAYQQSAAQNVQTMQQHLLANNPHNVTATTVGLGRFANVYKAVIGEYNAPEPNDLNYVSPALLKEVLTAGGSASSKTVSSADRVFDTVIGSNAEKAFAPVTTQYYDQTSAGGVCTYRGKTVKTATGLEVHASSGTNVSTTLHSGTGTMLGGFRIDGSLVGLVNGANNWLGYFNASGIFQHNGLNRVSDARVKNGLKPVELSDVDADSIGFYSWVWANDDRVSEYLQGKADAGVIAQEVLKVWPDAVSYNENADLYTVDDGKVALRLALIAMQRTAPKPSFVQWLLNLIKGK